MGPGQAVTAGPGSLKDLSALAVWCSKNVSGDRVCPDVPQPARNMDCWETRGVGNGERVSAMFWVPVKVLLVND